MEFTRRILTSLPQTLTLAVRGLRTWTPRRVAVAAAVAVVFGVLLGLATVLIPNPVFARDIPPVWWNYPVWILTSVFSGMLFATYVRGPRDPSPAGGGATPGADSGEGGEAEARRSSRFGIVGAALAWFAVGCPVCNKFALLALGYSGAITWFAPVQPLLAVVGLVLITVALVVRLRGQVACVLPATQDISPRAPAPSWRSTPRRHP